MQGERSRLLTTHDGLCDNVVYCLAASKDGTLWAGTKDGFSRLQYEQDDVTIDSYRTRDGLSQSTVFTIREDREGSLWVGTKHGLNQFLNRRTVPVTVSEGLPSNDTGPVLQDSAGNTWVGTRGAGLVRLDGRPFTVLTTAEGLPSSTILSLVDGGQAGLWVGTDRGVCRLLDDRVVERYGAESGLPSETIHCLCRDLQGTLWAGTSAGLAALRDGRFVAAPDDRAVQGLPVVALTSWRTNHLLVATPRGVWECVEGVLQPFGADQTNLRDVTAFYKDAHGVLWLGTEGNGLWLWNDDKMQQFTVRDGLHDDTIFGITADDQDSLWMACSKGIFNVRRADLRQFAAGKLAKLTCVPFSPMDAQRTIECQDGAQPVVWKMDDGRLWFSTIRGMLVVDPENLLRSLPPTPVVVEEVVVNGQHERPDTLVKLLPGAKNLQFRYSALSFVVPTRIKFRYRLEGFDRDWVDAGSRREAFYTNVPPGDYRFHVAALNVDGVYHDLDAPLRFTIEPQLYERGWFLTTCVLVAAFAVWAAYRLRVQQIKQQARLVVAERSRIARELHDTLMQGFSGITMGMQALAARLPPAPERETLEEIIGDAGQCLREARRSIAGLRNASADEHSGLAAALAQAARQLTETHDLQLALQLDRQPVDLPPDVAYNLLRIAQEALTNAVKHAQCHAIRVELIVTPRQLRIAVADNGIGFDAPPERVAVAGHYGLIGMRERAGQIGATLEVASEPERGTRVSVVLPLPTATTLTANETALNQPADSIAKES